MTAPDTSQLEQGQSIEIKRGTSALAPTMITVTKRCPDGKLLYLGQSEVDSFTNQLKVIGRLVREALKGGS